MLDRYKNNKIIFVIICTIVITMIFDTSIAKLYHFIYGQVFSASNIEQSINWNIAAFIAIAIVYVVGQYFVLGFVNSKSKVSASISESIFCISTKRPCYLWHYLHTCF
jgi:uncharacterized membrane protein